MYIWINHYHRRYVVIFTKMYLRQPSTVSLCQNELYSYKVNSVMRHSIVPLKSQRQEMIQYHSDTNTPQYAAATHYHAFVFVRKL